MTVENHNQRNHGTKKSLNVCSRGARLRPFPALSMYTVLHMIVFSISLLSSRMPQRKPRPLLIHTPIDPPTRRQRQIHSRRSADIVFIANLVCKPSKVIRQTASGVALYNRIVLRRRCKHWRWRFFVLESRRIERWISQYMYRS